MRLFEQISFVRNQMQTENFQTLDLHLSYIIATAGRFIEAELWQAGRSKPEDTTRPRA